MCLINALVPIKWNGSLVVSYPELIEPSAVQRPKWISAQQELSREGRTRRIELMRTITGRSPAARASHKWANATGLVPSAARDASRIEGR